LGDRTGLVQGEIDGQAAGGVVIAARSIVAALFLSELMARIVGRRIDVE